MGNREIRLFWQTERSGLRALLVAAAAIVSLAWVGESLAAGCDALAGGEGALLQTVVAVKGPAAVRRSIAVRANSEIIVFARERGVEITLEITDSQNTVLARGDSPTRRTGIQRAQLTPRSGEHYYVIVTKKEPASADGSVELRAIELKPADTSVCLAAQKVLAKADAAYAAGQAAGRAPTNTTGIGPGKSYEQAVAGYREAVEKLRGSGYSPLLGQAQLAEASILNLDLDGQAAEARTWALQAAETFAALGDPYNNARARGLAGAAAADNAVGDADVSAKLAEARKQLDQVVAFHAARNDLYDEAWARNYIGLTFYWEGRYEDALRAYKKALPLYQRLRERTRQGQLLQNIALVEYDVGRASDALPHLRQALELTRTTGGDPKVLAWILANIAMAHLDSGNEDVSLRELSDSLAIARTAGDLGVQSYDLLHIAQVYVKLADQDRALDFYKQALTLFKRLKDVRGATGSLRGMANIRRQQGHTEEALQMDREALSIEITPWARSRMNVQIAKDLIQLGRTGEATNVLEGVLRPGAESNEVVRAQALQERARLRAASNELTAAEADLRTAIATFKAYELPLDEFSSCISLARIMRQLGSTTEAFAAVDHALALAEELRLYSANPELRSTLLQPLRPAFDLKISMLSERYAAAKGNANEQEMLAVRALETAEQARARALADYQAIDLTTAGLDPTLLERRETLYRNLAERRARLADTLDTAGVDNSKVQAIRSEIATLRQELDQIDAKIGALAASNAARRPAATKSTSIQLANVPPGIAIVEYWLGSKDAYAWVITRDGVQMAPIGRSSAINSQAVALHTALRSFGSVPKSDRLAAGERLYALVLGPIANQIAGHRTLIFAPDGALHYVPFATLRYSEAGRGVFLVQNHDIAVTPSVQMFLQPGSGRPTPAHPRRMLLVDDPVYDPGDPRVAKEVPATNITTARNTGTSLSLVRGATPGQSGFLARLPGAAREAAAIAGLMPAGTVDRLEGFAANRERFLASGLGQYQLIHVASHATMDSEIPQASALILSTVDSSGKKIDGRVLGADFLGVRLHADTVVLSACDTALGKDVDGEGLIGLQYAVLARGARSVVSSLWPAIDPVTAPLMVEFYSALLHQHSSVISAWSAASRAALAGTYGDPGTWGAFMLTLSHVEDLNTR